MDSCPMKKYEIVKSKQVLKAMNKADVIGWPVKIYGEAPHDKNTYVRQIKPAFEFDSEAYEVRFVSGSFPPYVFKVIKNE